MAAQDRGQNIEVKELLGQRATAFSYIQAIRLLARDAGETLSLGGPEPSINEILETYIRVRPKLALTFPGTDMTRIAPCEDDPSKTLITATFLGLYGASSPLPAFYTEDLIDERNDEKSIKRDFIDIINNGIYALFFKIWRRHRLFYRLCEEQDKKAADLIYCLLGLESQAVRSRMANPGRLFRYTGLAMQFPRSAQGLVAILEDSFNLKGMVKINQCVLRRVAIPETQHAKLGKSCCTLGQDCVLGTFAADMNGKFQIVVSNADPKVLHALLPNQPMFKQLSQVVRFYVNQPLEWELVVEPLQDRIETARPGNPSWSNLGWNTWLAPGSMNLTGQKAKTVFH